MGIFAETYVLKVDLPFSEYWLPLIIGMGVGVCALSVSKLAFGRRKAVPKKAAQTFDRDPFTEGSTNEQRKSFRRGGNPTQVHVAFPDRKNQPAHGWVIDRSMGGIGLQVSNEYKPEEKLAVLPINAPEMTPWVDIVVRTCRANDDGYELGCQFVKTPNWSVLLMFG
jgi:hypothetical protein